MTEATVRIIACFALIAATFALTTPARAGQVSVTLTTTDAKHDVYAAGGPSRAMRAETDLVRVYLGRGVHRVWARFVVRGITPKMLHKTMYEVELHHKNTSRAYAMVLWPGRRMKVELDTPSGGESCHGRGVKKVDYSDHYVQIGFPKSCFRRGWTANDNAAFRTSAQGGERKVKSPIFGTMWVTITAMDSAAIRHLRFTPRP